jgi:hypothetical protein
MRHYTTNDSRAIPILNRWRWVPLLLIVGMLFQCSIWAIDREPPFSVTSYTVQPVHVGGVLVVNADVRRDLDRECYVDLSSQIVDSVGVRWELGIMQSVTPDGVRELSAKSPGKLIRKINLPPGMSPGPASLLSSMIYRCNMLHDLVRPITVDTRFDFEVLP